MIPLETLKKIFERDGFIRNNDFEIVRADETGSTVRVKIERKHINANGTVHGGLLFSLADFGFGVAANCMHPVTVTSSGAITFVAPCVDTEYLTAESAEVSRYNRTCVYNSTIRDDSGNIVCIAQLNGFIKESKGF